MKNSLVLFACFLLLTLSCSKKGGSTTPPPPPPPSDVHLTAGLLVYLPFTGNIADSSGNANTVAAANGAALTSDRNGVANSAFGGTGAGQRLIVSSNGSIQFDTAFTFSLDVLVNNLNNEFFLAMLDNITAKGISFGYGIGLPNLNNITFSTADSLSTCSTFGSPSNTFIDTTQFIAQTAVWYNMIGIYHKGNLTVYVNGKSISTYKTAGITVPICSSAKLIVGGWWDGDPHSLDGKLDNVRLYNRVLNADEIDSLSKKFQ